ncbi:MAG TPA: DUF1801 domain-containing protein [Polyangiaceae bacterium]|nr:DUF1801 domain-containing protein [Polyangiaceae bacterium]
MRIAAEDPDAYVASVPEERREHLERVRSLVRETVPDADEKILWGMIGWEIHGRPFAAVASQKESMSLYLMDLYTQPALMKEHAAALKKVAKGKSCLHFRRAGELPLDVVAKILSVAPSIAVDVGTLGAKRSGADKPHPRKPAAKKSIVDLRSNKPAAKIAKVTKIGARIGKAAKVAKPAKTTKPGADVLELRPRPKGAATKAPRK